MQFQDELAAGVVLVRPALQSPDYVTGVSGWAIKIDGSAEFNDIVIRGGSVLGGESLYYDGAPALGNLILSISGSGGVDPFGNVYPEGLGLFGSDGSTTADGSVLTVTGNNGSAVQVSTGGVGQADIFFTPRDLVGSTWFDGTVGTVLGSGDRPGISITSPAADVPGAIQSSIDLYGSGAGGLEAYILIACDRMNVNGLFQAPNLQSGQESVSFVALSSHTQAVVFPEPYAVGTVPVVTTNIASSAGVTARWGSRAYNISNTGFTLFLFEGDSADPAQTWANVPVGWWAHAD